MAAPGSRFAFDVERGPRARRFLMIRVPPNHRPLLSLGSAGLSLLLGGCSLTLDASRSQCQADVDCAGATALTAPRCLDGLCETRAEWRCTSADAAPRLADQSTSVNVALPVVDLLARQGVSLEASVCRKLDVNCEAPTQSMAMGGTGEYPLRLESGFDGYLSVRGESVAPTLYFFSPPLVEGERLPTLTLMSESLMGSLARELGVPLIAGRGLALFTVQDCSGAFSPGVTFEAREADATTTRYYDIDGLPAVPAAATGPAGSGGFLNVPLGPLSVDARLPDAAVPLASTSVWVRAGFISHGNLRPPPASPGGS
jgi:hypothetical protein